MCRRIASRICPCKTIKLQVGGGGELNACLSLLDPLTLLNQTQVLSKFLNHHVHYFYFTFRFEWNNSVQIAMDRARHKVRFLKKDHGSIFYSAKFFLRVLCP